MFCDLESEICVLSLLLLSEESHLIEIGAQIVVHHLISFVLQFVLRLCFIVGTVDLQRRNIFYIAVLFFFIFIFVFILAFIISGGLFHRLFLLFLSPVECINTLDLVLSCVSVHIGRGYLVKVPYRTVFCRYC